ncbi:GUN4 domain-containing protein [Aphanizomenon sp. PH219]|nr:GUN4 domain-containing protein [Aphanizomenon sp. 202]MDK2458054.1 GUN4 domain-containing protein [Aphanizomenon sp. PH219]
MSDSPIQPQPNQPEKSQMADISIFSSIISGGFQVWTSKINQDTQLKVADKNRETQIKLEYLRNELREASDLKQFERQKELQLELAKFNRDTQLKLAAQQRETTLALPEVNKLFEHWPLRIVPSLILNSPISNNRPPLKVIIAPPEINFDKFGNATQNLPKMENTLAQGLRQFLDKNYSHHSQIRPVEFLDGAWDSNKYHGGASIKVLFEMLKSEPLLILESEIEGDYLNFRVAYWGYGDTQYKYATALARLPYTNIIYESAKARAIKWKPARDMLIQQGKNPKLINELDTHNLEILEEEEQLKSFGIDTSDLPPRYKVNNKDFDAFYQFLITIHALFAGLTIDFHYLIHYDVTPLLPGLLSELVVRDKQIIGTIVSNYQEVYHSLENDRSAWIPELFLDLANSLIYLPDKSWAREQLNSSVRYWLSLRGVNTYSNDLLDLLEATRSFLKLQDKEYLEKLKQCLIKLGDTQGVKKVTDLWLNTEEAERIRQQQLITSKADFRKLDQLLSARKWKEADQETTQLILKCGDAHKSYKGFLDGSIANFPKEELRIMDDLWVKYSHGRFGFSVQKKIWIDCGGTAGVYNGDVFKKFCDRLGWKTNHYPIYFIENYYSISSEFIFNTNQPQEELPIGWRLMLDETLKHYTVPNYEMDQFISFFSIMDYNT